MLYQKNILIFLSFQKKKNWIIHMCFDIVFGFIHYILLSYARYGTQEEYTHAQHDESVYQSNARYRLQRYKYFRYMTTIPEDNTIILIS